MIEDEQFRTRFGGRITPTGSPGPCGSTRAWIAALITDLISDVAWSNEGLFALLQGLRRLAETGGRRVDLPAIEWEIS